jgi:hypothetical protein
MDQERFDSLARRAGRIGTRRGIVGAGLGGVLGALAIGDLDARKRKSKQKGNGGKPKPNEFGCLNVGKACAGNDDTCCSGICQGQKPKKGEKDKSRCVGHDALGCTPQRSQCVVENLDDARCNLPNQGSFCMTTTGNAGFCSELAGLSVDLVCRPCSRDRDCVAFGFTPGSACVDLRAGNCAGSCAETGGRACLPPAL